MLPVIVILILTLISYWPVFKHEFINWDDNLYVRDNTLVHSLDLKSIFTTNVAGNYHPITILGLALQYHFFGMNPGGFHVVSLVLHLLNSLLVFFVMLQLTRKTMTAFIAALLFGVHPIHVESVAWIAEQKDLLYTLFFLGSCYYYLRHFYQPGRFTYFLSVSLFILALLSKAMAASLPFVLLLFDFLLGKKFTANSLLNKIPFFLCALAFGMIAVAAQKSSGATEMMVFPFGERILFACYGFVMYLAKLVIPLQLCAFYPYPVKPGEIIPALYYVFPFICLVIAALGIYSLRHSRRFFFGIAFFSVTVFLVLQLYPVGRVIMADRYCYIPSIGIFYLAGMAFDYFYNTRLQFLFIGIITLFSAFFTYQSNQQCMVWRNSMSLWSDVISKYQNIPAAYNNRGLAFKELNNPERSLQDFSKAINLDPDYEEAFINRGNVYRDQKRNDEAIADYSKAIALNPKLEKAYVNRGILYLFNWREEEALADFNKAIQLNPNYPESHYHKGLAFYNQKKYTEAIPSYNRAIQLRANYPQAWFSRGVSQYYSGNTTSACNDLRQARNLGYPIPQDVWELICK